VTVRFAFPTEISHEDAIGSHTCSLEASMPMNNGIHLGCPVLLPVGIAIIRVQTLKAFARVADISRGLQQIGIEERVLRGLAKRLKNEAYLEAARVLAAAYADEQVHEAKPLPHHLRTIVERWMETGCIVGNGSYASDQPTDMLLDDLQACRAEGLLEANSRTRSFGSNPTRVAAAAAYLLVNPDVAGDDDDAEESDDVVGDDGETAEGAGTDDSGPEFE
jgi:hypothetical protein